MSLPPWVYGAGGRPSIKKRPAKRKRRGSTRRGYSSVARSRGAAVTGEMKYFDCDRTSTAVTVVTTAWVAGTIVDPGTTINLGDAPVATPLCLFAPKVSAALNGRVGRKCMMKKVRVTGHIFVPVQAGVGTADNCAKIRILLVLDSQTNSAQMTSASLLGGGTAVETTISSMQNPDFFGRFRVLKEKTFVLQNPNLTGSPTAVDCVQNSLLYPFKLSFVFKGGMKVLFNATNGGTVADIIDNSLHIICGVQSTSLAPTIQYYSRVCYKDL